MARKVKVNTNCYICLLPNANFYKAIATGNLLCSKECKAIYFSFINISDIKIESNLLKKIIYLFPILCSIESNNNALAIGDNGLAIGILQIHEVVIKDVNEAYGTKYRHVDCKSIEVSRDIFKKYLTLYSEKFIDDFGREPTIKDLSRIWNGGPEGHKKESTLKYWSKVERVSRQKFSHLHKMFL